MYLFTPVLYFQPDLWQVPSKCLLNEQMVPLIPQCRQVRHYCPILEILSDLSLALGLAREWNWNQNPDFFKNYVYSSVLFSILILGMKVSSLCLWKLSSVYLNVQEIQSAYLTENQYNLVGNTLFFSNIGIDPSGIFHTTYTPPRKFQAGLHLPIADSWACFTNQ